MNNSSRLLLGVVASVAMLGALVLCTPAKAAKTHSLIGLFCNTESQVRQVFDSIPITLNLDASVEIINRDEVVCVYAKDNKYLIENPVIIGKLESYGMRLAVYEATLVGTLVGANRRPIEPPVKTFFARMEILEGAVEQTAL